MTKELYKIVIHIDDTNDGIMTMRMGDIDLIRSEFEVLLTQLKSGFPNCKFKKISDDEVHQMHPEGDASRICIEKCNEDDIRRYEEEEDYD